MSSDPIYDDLAAQLEDRTQELNELVYAVSHDLRQPLRSVLHNLEFLDRRYADRLDERGQDFVARGIRAAQRGNSMIEDLLVYSRITTRARPPEPVDVGECLARVERDLADAIAATKATITRDDTLPTVLADRQQLRLLLHHLVDNAIKFHGKQPPCLHVSCQRQDDRWHLTFTDHGEGVPEKDLERIFRPFQLLHARGEYDGNGMGLAICRRIAQRHNALLTAESPPGKGTVLHLSWPIMKPQEAAEATPRPKVQVRRVGE